MYTLFTFKEIDFTSQLLSSKNSLEWNRKDFFFKSAKVHRSSENLCSILQNAGVSKRNNFSYSINLAGHARQSEFQCILEEWWLSRFQLTSKEMKKSMKCTVRGKHYRQKTENKYIKWRSVNYWRMKKLLIMRIVFALFSFHNIVFGIK